MINFQTGNLNRTCWSHLVAADVVAGSGYTGFDRSSLGDYTDFGMNSARVVYEQLTPRIFGSLEGLEVELGGDCHLHGTLRR